MQRNNAKGETMTKEDLQRLERLNKELAALETMRQLNIDCGVIDYDTEVSLIIKERRAEVDKLFHAIKAMRNPLSRALLIDYYINKMTVAEMARKYNYAASHIYRLKNNAESELCQLDV